MGQNSSFLYAFLCLPVCHWFFRSLALSHRILTDGAPAVRDYIDFLKAGGSDYPINVLKKAGVDMTTKAPVASALSVFSSVLDETEAVITSLGL